MVGVSPVEAAPGSLGMLILLLHVAARLCLCLCLSLSPLADKMLLLWPNPAGPTSTQAQIPPGCWNHPLSPCLAQLGTLSTAKVPECILCRCIQCGLGAPGTPECIWGVRDPSKQDVACWGSLHLQGSEVLPVPQSAVDFGPPCVPSLLLTLRREPVTEQRALSGAHSPACPGSAIPQPISNQLP